MLTDERIREFALGVSLPYGKITFARAIEAEVRKEQASKIAELERQLAEARQAVREAVPEGFVVVSAEFMRGFRSLTHNYSLKAVPPFYYHGVEGDAFSDAYARCGRDLASLLAAAKEAVPHETILPRIVSSKCWCESCDLAANNGLRSRMSVCPECGDKRCAKAEHHDSNCSAKEAK